MKGDIKARRPWWLVRSQEMAELGPRLELAFRINKILERGRNASESRNGKGKGETPK